MNVVRLVIGLCAALLRLYSERFRAEFEEEMQAVSADALGEAVGRGYALVTAACP